LTDQSPPKPKKTFRPVSLPDPIKHYTYITEKTFVHWEKRYILLNNKRLPVEMGASEIEAFLTHLAKEGNVSSSTQNQALNALLFLYRNVLQIDLSVPILAMSAKRSEHLPTVLSKDEASRAISYYCSRRERRKRPRDHAAG